MRVNTFEPNLQPPRTRFLESYPRFTGTPNFPSLVLNEADLSSMTKNVRQQYNYMQIDEMAKTHAVDPMHGLLVTRDQRDDANTVLGNEFDETFGENAMTKTQVFDQLRRMENSLTIKNKTRSFDPYTYPSKKRIFGMTI